MTISGFVIDATTRSDVSKICRSANKNSAIIEVEVVLVLTIFADNYQFYIQDDDDEFGDLSDAWTPEAVDRLMAVAPHTIGVGTMRNMEVSVEVQLLQAEPTIDESVFDRTNKCSIQIDTGRVVVAGCTDYFPEAERVQCSPGTYHVLVGYRGVNTISDDGLDGEDSYHIFLWPAAG